MVRARRKWAPEEDNTLRNAVNHALSQQRPLLWRELSRSVPGRSNKDCRRRWWNSLAEGTRKGPWSEEEDRRLIDAVNKYGTNWVVVAGAVGSRNSDQCSGHWNQVLDPNINFADWTAQEDHQLLHSVLTHGTNWATIATTHVPKRNTLALKNRYSTLRREHRSPHKSGQGQGQEQGQRQQGSMRKPSPGATPSTDSSTSVSHSTSRKRRRGSGSAYSYKNVATETSGWGYDDSEDGEEEDDDDDDDDDESGNSSPAASVGTTSSYSTPALDTRASSAQKDLAFDITTPIGFDVSNHFDQHPWKSSQQPQQTTVDITQGMPNSFLGGPDGVGITSTVCDSSISSSYPSMEAYTTSDETSMANLLTSGSFFDAPIPASDRYPPFVQHASGSGSTSSSLTAGIDGQSLVGNRSPIMSSDQLPFLPESNFNASPAGGPIKKYRVSIDLVCEFPQLQQVMAGLTIGGTCISVKINSDV